MTAGKNDEGASLVIVLIFITVVGAVIATVSNLGITAFRSTDATRATDEQYAAADAALEEFVSTMRGNAAVGVPGNCPDKTFGSTTTPYVNGTYIKVQCIPSADSGASTAPPGGTVPQYSLHTLGSTATGQAATNFNGRVSVAGDIAVEGELAVFSGAKAVLAVQRGDVVVGGSCPDARKLQLDIGRSSACNVPAAVPSDPALVPTSLSAWAARPLNSASGAIPTCSGSVLTFAPGTYTSASALNALTNGACAGKLLWFQPGVYYFNFGASSWKIDDPSLRLVGGTPTSSWNPATGSGVSSTTPSLPGACVVQSASEDVDGVQFVFGGQSQLDVQNGALELCPEARAGRQQIAIYAPISSSLVQTGGLPAYAASATPTATILYPSGGAVGTPGSSSGRSIDGAVDRQAPTGGSPNKFLAWSATGFSTGASPQPIDTTRVVIRHMEENISTSTVVTVRVGATVLGTIPACATLCDSPPLTLPAALFASTTSLAAATIRMDVEWGNAATANFASLDGMRLDVVRTAVGAGTGVGPSPYAPAAGCANAALSSSPCYVVSVGEAGGAETGALYARGTVYAPQGRLFAALFKQTAPAFSRGLVTWGLSFSSKSNSVFSGAIVSLPSGGPLNRNVRLLASVCDAAFTSCSARLSATAAFDDGSGPGAKVTYTQYSATTS